MAPSVTSTIPDKLAHLGLSYCYHGATRHPVDSSQSADEVIQGTEALVPHVWEGDDDHVIFWMLSLTPTQRVEVAQEFIEGVMMLRNGLRS